MLPIERPGKIICVDALEAVHGYLCPNDASARGAAPALPRPPRYLADGDEVTVEIEGIGTLTNPVRA